MPWTGTRPTRWRLVLAGAGAFLLAVGLLLRFYAAPRLIAAPAGFAGTLILTDPHGSYFNQRTLKTVSDAPLTYTATIRGDAAVGRGPIAVWDIYSELKDVKHHVVVNDIFQRAAFNRRTAQLTDCCGASVNDDTSVRQYGVPVVDWPIGLQKRTYQVFDVNTEKDWPAAYTGTATVGGITTYKYVQHVSSTLVQEIPNTPISVLGVPGISYNVTARRYYQADNTYWVDPRTGDPVNVEEKITSTLTDPAGDASLTVASADLKMAPSAQAFLVGVARNGASEISFLKVTGPLSGIIAGVLLLAAAVLPWRRLSPILAKRGST